MNYVYSKLKYKNNIYLSKDLAFYITGIEKYKNIKGVCICNCYREDSEKTNINVPKNNIDLSNSLNKPGNTTNIDSITEVSESIFNYLSKFDQINTNRLHMAIAGSLLNKNVNFYPNNYYKNKEIYLYSLKNKYKKTIFNSM